MCIRKNRSPKHSYVFVQRTSLGNKNGFLGRMISSCSMLTFFIVVIFQGDRILAIPAERSFKPRRRTGGGPFTEVLHKTQKHVQNAEKCFDKRAWRHESGIQLCTFKNLGHGYGDRFPNMIAHQILAFHTLQDKESL